MKLLASVRCWPLLWSLPLLIRSPSDQGATSRPGSVLCRNSTPQPHPLARKQGYHRGVREPALLIRPLYHNAGLFHLQAPEHQPRKLLLGEVMVALDLPHGILRAEPHRLPQVIRVEAGIQAEDKSR